MLNEQKWTSDSYHAEKNSINGPTHGPTHFVVLWSSGKMSPQSTIIMILRLHYITIYKNQETSWFHVKDSFYTFYIFLSTLLHVTVSSEFLCPHCRLLIRLGERHHFHPLSTELTFLQNWKPLPNPSHALLPPPSPPLHHCYLEEGTQANSFLWDPSLCGDTAERANPELQQRCDLLPPYCRNNHYSINIQDMFGGRRRCNMMQQAKQTKHAGESGIEDAQCTCRAF